MNMTDTSQNSENSQPDAPEAPVLTRVEGRAGHIVLNRPRAINALTHEMVGIIHDQLRAWAEDDQVATVVLTGAGERGFCAGGDIVALYEDARAGGAGSGESDSARFWADEYRLNEAIATYPKPVVAIMDGIVLGGGIGLSAHASVRVVTERSKIGMPETGIGFFPDVGGTWLLAHAPGETGTHLALTAGSVKAADAIEVGLAEHLVNSDHIPELLERLATEDPLAVVGELAEPAGTAPLAEARGWIDEAYRGDDLVAILDRLRDSDSEDANKAAETIGGKAPTSLVVTLRALREAKDLPDLAAALNQEYRLALRFHAAPDFVEGVRAQVVDKDRNPSWSPASIEEVDPATVDAFFAPLDSPELNLTRQTAQES